VLIEITIGCLMNKKHLAAERFPRCAMQHCPQRSVVGFQLIVISTKSSGIVGATSLRLGLPCGDARH
jgi:hypothetical protein